MLRLVCDDDKLKQKHTLSIQFQNLTENRRYRGTIDIPNTHIHEISLPWVATGNSIKGGSVKLVYGQNIHAQTLRSDMEGCLVATR